MFTRGVQSRALNVERELPAARCPIHFGSGSEWPQVIIRLLTQPRGRQQHHDFPYPHSACDAAEPIPAQGTLPQPEGVTRDGRDMNERGGPGLATVVPHCEPSAHADTNGRDVVSSILGCLPGPQGRE